MAKFAKKPALTEEGQAEAVKAKKAAAPKTLAETCEGISKDHGKKAVLFADNEMFQIRRFPSGIPSLDFQLGCGVPEGRIIHIPGPEHGGKTHLALVLVAAAQRAHPDKSVMWVDFERSFDPLRAVNVGVDLSRLLLTRPVLAEQAFDEVLRMAPFISMAVVDSVAALYTAAEMVATMSDQQMGVNARVLGKFLRKWISDAAPENGNALVPSLILCNQFRANLKGYGKDITTPGGWAMLHYPSVCIEVRRGEKISLKSPDADGEDTFVGHYVDFNIVKNNTFAPDKKGRYMLCTRPYSSAGYPIGVNQVDWPASLLKYAAFYGVVAKEGAWYTFPGAGLKVQGAFAAQAAMFNDGELAHLVKSLVEKEIRIRHGLKEESSGKMDDARVGGGRKDKGKKNPRFGKSVGKSR